MKNITKIEAKEILANKEAILIDVRSEKEFADNHLVNSVNIPLDKVKQIKDVILKSKKTIIFVCKSGVRSKMACKELDWKKSNIFYLDAGFEELSEENDVVRGKASWPIERQVRLVAGSLVLTGTVLGSFLNGWFYVIPFFIGAGLTFAAISNSCMMGVMLMKLPYNKTAVFSEKEIRDILGNKNER